MKVLHTCTGTVAMTTLSYFTDQAASNVGKIRFTRMANSFVQLTAPKLSANDEWQLSVHTFC